MSGIKKFLGGRKKSSASEVKSKKESPSGSGSIGSLTGLSKSSSSLNLAASVESLGGYNIKPKDLSKFLKTVWNGDLQKLKQLASKKVNWNETDKGKRTALHLACARGFDDIVDFLVSHGAKVNIPDSEGKTPLMKACDSNSIKVVECLLNNGAETNVFDINHVSPLHIASAQGNTDIGYLLADCDAKLDVKDQNQITPLHLACGLGHKEFVEFLLNGNVTIDALDIQRRTPLMMACIDGHLDIVKFLLQNKADTTLLDKEGSSAEDLASANDHVSIETVLNEHSKMTVASPRSSVYSPESAKDLYSPVVQSLNDMFSPTASMPSTSLFGGPAMNTGGNEFNDKSEESQSEVLGDNSWKDSDSGSEIEQQPKGINISAMLKRKSQETMKKPSDVKMIPEQDVAKETSEWDDESDISEWDQPVDSKKQPKGMNISALLKRKSEETMKKPSDVMIPEHDVAKETSEWDDESDISEWDQPPLDNKKENHVKDTVNPKEAEDKNQKTSVPFVVPPPPPPDIDFSEASDDLNSSQPDATFSDVPLSDVEGNVNHDDKAINASQKLLVGKDSKDGDDSKWDSDDDEIGDNNDAMVLLDDKNKVVGPRKSDANNNVTSKSSGVKLNEELSTNDNLKFPVKDKQTHPSMTPAADDESDWDSEPSLKSEPSEEVLPPRTPEMASEFEHSSDDENVAAGTLPQELASPTPKDKSTVKAIFQTEVFSPREESDNDDIEQQILATKPKPASKSQNPSKAQSSKNTSAENSARNKQLTDLGLDLGSSISDVSDPEGIEPSELPKSSLPNVQEDVLFSDDDTDTESESQWEKENREKKLAAAMNVNTNVNKNEPSKSLTQLQQGIDSERIEERRKDLKRVEEHEKQQKEKENRIAAEIAEELRQEMMNADVEDEVSSDFSYNEVELGLSVQGDDDEAEAKLVQQMESKEKEFISQQQQQVQQTQKQNLKEEGMKSKLQDILERSKSPPSPVKVTELLEKKEADLQRLHENLDAREQEILRREQESNDRVREAELEKKRIEEEVVNRLNKAKEDEETMERLKRQHEEEIQEIKIKQKEIEEDVEKRNAELLEKEQEVLKKMKEHDLEIQENLSKEETARMHALQASEREAKEEHERLKALLYEELENERKAIKTKFQDIEAEGVQKKKLLEEEENKRLRALSDAEKEHRQKLVAVEREIEENLRKKEAELEKMEKETTKQKQMLDEQELQIKKLEQIKLEKKRLIEEELRKEEDLVKTRLKEEQTNLYEQMEKQAKEKEQEIEARMMKLEKERLQQIESHAKKLLEDNEKLRREESAVEEQESLNCQSFEEELETRRQKLTEELSEEEMRRKRKMSDEERTFQLDLEKQRERMLKEIAERADEDRKKLQAHLEEDKLLRMSEFSREAAEREVELEIRLREIEAARTKEIQEQATLKELEMEKRLEKLNEDKEKEWRKKEEFLKRKIEENNEKGDENRFHQLEKQSLIRERELERQLAELRDKQIAGKNAKNHQGKSSVLTPIPVEEIIVTTSQANTEEALPSDLFVNLETTPRGGQEEDQIKSPEKSLNDFEKKLPLAAKRPSHNSYLTSSPLKYTRTNPASITSSGHILDDSEFDQLEAELNDTRREVGTLRDKNVMQERIRRDMEYDMEELHKTIEILSHSQSEKEKTRLDADLEHRTLKYKFEQELENKAMMDRLCHQLKDQLSRSEKKITREAESRQTLELANRKLQVELKTKDQIIQKLEADIIELQLTLETEKNSRSVQEELYQEQLRQHEVILQETQRTSHSHAQAVSKLEALDETCKQAEITTDSLKMELAKAKGELSRVQSQLDESRSLSDEQMNRLRDKLQEKSDNLMNAEKQLFQVQIQLDNERALKKENEDKVATVIENETINKKRLEQEIINLKSRLENSNREIDKLGEIQVTAKQDTLSLREKMMNERNELSKELTFATQQLNTVKEQLAISETKITILSDKLEKASFEIAEKKVEASMAVKESDDLKVSVQDLEQKLRDEKLQSSKMETQLESSNERICFLQNECEKLREELSQTKENLALREKSTSEKQDAVNSHLMTIKDDHHKERTELLLKHEHNVKLLDKLQTEHFECKKNLAIKIEEVQKLTEELLKTKTDLADAETDKTVYVEERNKFLAENDDLKEDINGLVEEMQKKEKVKDELEQQCATIKSELEQSRMVTDETTQRLVQKSEDIENMRENNLHMEQNIFELKRHNASMEANLREEKVKGDLLLQDLHSANQARESLEKLLSNVKGNSAALEEKLHSETLHRSQQEKDAQEHKNLWESEVKSRSKLGLKMMELEKTVQNLKTDLETEKKKTRRALDLKKGSDGKVEIYEQRSGDQMKEMTALRNKLKQYQKRLKEYETGEGSMNNNVNRLRRQLDDLSERLSREKEMRTKAELNYRNQLKELNDLKTNDKVRSYEMDKVETKCRNLQEELEKQQHYFQDHYLPQKKVEEIQRALETKARLDLNKKLQEVNMHLEEQALAREAFEKIRNDKESKMKKEFEDTILDLKSELSVMRSSLHDGLAKRDTSDAQVGRYKEMFEMERSAKDRVTDSLTRTKERLNKERNRTNYLFDEAMNKSKVSKKLFNESIDKDKNRSLLSPHKMGFYDSDLNNGSRSFNGNLWSTPLAGISPPYRSIDQDCATLRRSVFS